MHAVGECHLREVLMGVTGANGVWGVVEGVVSSSRRVSRSASQLEEGVAVPVIVYHLAKTAARS